MSVTTLRLRRRRLPVVVALGITVVVVAVAASAGGGEPRTPSVVVLRDPTPEIPAELPVVPAPRRAWPTSSWPTIRPESAGFDRSALDAMAYKAGARRSECLVVTRHGRLVGEWYWNGFDATTRRDVYSVTKSIASTLVGIAEDRGKLRTDQWASDFVTEWRDTPSEAVTIANLLANDSGRFHSPEVNHFEVRGAADKTGLAIGLEQQHAPGSTWVYNNAAVQTLDAVLERATGTPTHQFAEEELFEPLGMEMELARDEAGGTVTFTGAKASCRDLARFGLLFLRNGEWRGRQVVSPEWVASATSPSQSLNPSYGRLWWLNEAGRVGDGSARGRAGAGLLVPEAPEDMYAAVGLGYQFVAVFPSSGVVVSRLGQLAEGAPAFSVADVGKGLADALVGPGEAPSG